MGYLEGLLGGFTGRKREVEQENIRQSDLANQRESKVYEALINSPDEHVRALAVTGLLTSAQAPQRKSGLRGWMGEMAANPAMDQIRALVGTQVPTPETTSSTTLSTRAISGALPTPPASSGNMAQPSTAATTPGAPPLASPSPLPTPGPSTQVGTPPTAGLTSTPSPGKTTSTTSMVMQPRQIFETPEQGYAAKAIGTQRGDVEGRVAGYVAAGGTREEGLAIERARQQRGAGGLGISHVAVELPDGTQHMAIFDARRQQYIDPDTQQPLTGAKPLTHTGSTSLGADRESVSRELGYGPAAAIKDPAAMAHVNAELQRRQGVLKPSAALSAASRMLPNATVQQQLDLADGLMEGTATPVAGGAPGVAPGVGSAPPGQAAPAPAGAGAPAASGAAGAAPAPGAKGLGAHIPAAITGATRELGKPVPPAIQQAIAKTKSMNDTIDKALAALEPYKTDTSLEGTMKLAEKYRAGTEGSPGGIDAAQLGDLAGLQQSASATLGGASRSQRIYADKRQHTPRLPSGRQIMLAHGTTGTGLPGLGADRTQQWSQLRGGDEAGFDSPAQMYNKLKNLREVNTQFISDMAAGTTVQTGTSVGTAPPKGASAAPAAGPPNLFNGADGKLHTGSPTGPLFVSGVR